ncbi:hypothetical protein NL676_010926 [Syzygium grande]|nr:hypothetical protein NL676_010926 [Syzygium grande]
MHPTLVLFLTFGGAGVCCWPSSNGLTDLRTSFAAPSSPSDWLCFASYHSISVAMSEHTRGGSCLTICWPVRI